MYVSYDYLLVAVSLLVAILASYAALELTARAQTLREAGRSGTAWLVGGAAVMGTGIWSMHLIAMLVGHMPVGSGYDPLLTGLALLIAVVCSFIALQAVSIHPTRAAHMVLGGVAMGVAIAAMHYAGILALHLRGVVAYNGWLVADGPLVTLSVVIGIVVSWLAFRVSSRRLDESEWAMQWRRFAGGLLLALAIAGMHMTGVHAVTIHSERMQRMGEGMSRMPGGVNAHWLASFVAAATLLLLIGALMFSRMDRGYDSKTNRMEASLFNAHQQLIVMATQDALTELPNRGSLMQRMHEMTARTAATGRPFTVMFVDLDGFKTINDSLGHAAGDTLLLEFARHLRSSLRGGDMVGRMGGDEFVVLLDGIGLEREVTPIVKTILERLPLDFVVGGTPLRVTASVGLASSPQDGLAAEDLLRHADLAMYAAKQGGKNAFRFYEEEMSRVVADNLLIYRALLEALAKDEMTLHYQPKYSGEARIGGREMVGAEALIRWHHPEMGEIAPRLFIPMAERTGLIVRIGNWVIEEVCRQLRAWDREGLARVKIAINLSPDQLCHPQAIDRVMEILNAAGVTPDRIMFEITETAAMCNAELSGQLIREFQTAGFEMGIDDFGTGYSSLAYLQRFHFKQLKIDKFFIQGLDREDESGSAIVAAILAMAHSLGMVVVAEGVETEAQLRALEELGCDQMQGYFLGRPQSATDFGLMLRRVRVG